MMTSRIFGHPGVRPLFIDFNVYTDGDDVFKKELVELMINNLHELRQTVKQNDTALFHKVCHKIKPTIEILNDQELSHTIDQLKVIATESVQIALLDKLCAEIIKSLQKE